MSKLEDFKNIPIQIGLCSDGITIECDGLRMYINQEDNIPEELKIFLEHIGFTNVTTFEDY